VKRDLLNVILISVILVLGLYSKELYEKAEQEIETVYIEPIYEYGIPVDSLQITSGVVKKNQIIADIWKQLGLAYSSVHAASETTKTIFDFRKIKNGNLWKAFTANDSANTVKYFVYEINATDYVVYNFENDSIRATLGKKEIVTLRKTATATITSSLWNALADQNLSTELSGKLSDIYAWSIDFFGLQNNDRFKVIYDEQFVDSVSIGIGKIHAVIFNHAGKDYYAFAFKQDSVESYYDEHGNSLRKAFLKAPLKFSRISSHFSYARKHPVLKIVRPHLGVDYAAPAGTPVYSIGDGLVTDRTFQGGGAGNYIRIKHNGVYTTVYMHLKSFAEGIHKGSRVSQGQVIGYVGSSGLSTGAHLDFRFFKNGQAINPLKVEAPPVEPVKENLRTQFAEVIGTYKSQLSNIQLAELLSK